MSAVTNRGKTRSDVAPLAAHRIRNDGPQDLHLLVVSAARSHGGREELAS